MLFLTLVLVGGGAVSSILVVNAFAAGGGNPPTPVAQTIVCPTPVLPAVPAAAQAEVTRELGNLDRQIAEANTRLANTVGQGGPNFVQNAILGPLTDKRKAVLDRIAIDIGRITTKPQGLDKFAACSLGQAGQPAPPPTSPPTTQPPATGGGTGSGATAQKIVCPTPVLPVVPAGAQAEVTRELGNLDKQIAEANTRLANTVGQGGPNFVQNAILGPLADKRKAVLDRIAIDIGRITTKPQGLDKFATCALR